MIDKGSVQVFNARTLNQEALSKRCATFSAKVYLAGPIFQQSDATCNDWRAKFKACELFEWLDPMARDYRGREDTAFAEIVDGDKEDIDECKPSSPRSTRSAPAPAWKSCGRG
jgi:hypothetical protein